MAKKKQQLDVRNKRDKDWFWLDDDYLNGYAKKLGPVFSMIYINLCRHSDKDQKAFPSQKQIAKELSISRRTVNEGIKVLRYFHLIKKKRIGKRCTNRYWLLDKRNWRKDFSELRKLRDKFQEVKEKGGDVKEYYNTYQGDVKELHITCETVAHLVSCSFTSNSKGDTSKENTKKGSGASSSEFSLEDKLEKMSNDNKRHIQIIGIWMEERGLQPKNKKQYQQIIKRYLRPAKRLEGYSNEEIRKTIDYVSNVDHIDKPSLETVEKYIDDLIAGNLKGRKPKTWEY